MKTKLVKGWFRPQTQVQTKNKLVLVTESWREISLIRFVFKQSKTILLGKLAISSVWRCDWMCFFILFLIWCLNEFKKQMNTASFGPNYWKLQFKFESHWQFFFNFSDCFLFDFTADNGRSVMKENPTGELQENNPSWLLYFLKNNHSSYFFW